LIQRRLFTEGADVQAGQVLYEIDPAPFKAALDHAAASLEAARKAADRSRAALDAGIAGVAKQQATLAFARTNRQRFEDLLKENAVSARDSDQSVAEADVAVAAFKAAEAQVQSDRAAVAASEAAIQQSQAALETARINLGYTKITAPIPGRIGKSTVTDGAIVTAFQPGALATIQCLDPIYVDVPQSTTDLLRLQRRVAGRQISRDRTNLNQVQLILADGSRYPLEGTLQFRDISVDSSTASVILRMVFPNPNGVLLPGMFVRAVIRDGFNDQAILIPQQAVVRDPKGNPMAMLVGADATVQPRMLTLDRAIGDQWLVTAGLSAGDRVIVEGFQRARPGTNVIEVPFVAGSPTNPPAVKAQPAAKAN
jgi:membrane fusion protein (multidrug efflux system)